AAAPPPAPVADPKLQPTEKQLRETAPFVDMPEPAGAAPAAAAAARRDARKNPGELPGYREVPALGLSPFAPQGFWAAPGPTPVFGSHPPDSGLRFDFHGYLQVPLRVGIGSRPAHTDQQNAITLHGDPVLPGASFGWFDQTPTVPWPWAQVNFVLGNDVVQATAILGAWNIGESMTASTYFQNPAEVWFAQAFVAYTPKLPTPVGVKFVAGAYPERYGPMAEYSRGCIWNTAVCSTGAYPTPFIAYVRGVGATTTATFPFEYDLDLTLEGGFKGNLNHLPLRSSSSLPMSPDFTSSPSNNFASAAQGSSFAGHAHAALTYQQKYRLTLHYVHAFEHDDRPDGFDDPATTQTNEAIDSADGRVQVIGADASVNADRFGYLYLGVAKASFYSVEHMDDIVQILNTGSGKLLMQRYLGQQGKGTGGLLLLGAQYTMSLGTLLRYPTEFWGEGPDLVLSLFGLYADTSSDDPTFDGKKMFKYGTEVTYSILPWLALSGRIDHVVPDARDMQQSFAVFSPKLIFRNDWQGSWRGGTLTLQYAAYVLGDHVVVNGDTRLMNNPSGRPDTQLLSIAATLGW
ncbi:MAG: hypothetical protein JOZ69_14305, partial [Myxococcales bacterium]|nr:hypothetical protein [Myxococcales bacterium]